MYIRNFSTLVIFSVFFLIHTTNGFKLVPNHIFNRNPSISNSVVSDINTADLIPVKVIPTAHDIYTGRDPGRVKIFDTTLRDGEQSPGCTMNTEEKIVVARQLARLGVDIIEAGFPVSSDGDFEAVNKIANMIGNLADPPIICNKISMSIHQNHYNKLGGLARSIKNDIKVCYDAIKPAKFPRIHLFVATSDIHMEHKLKKTRFIIYKILPLNPSLYLL